MPSGSRNAGTGNAFYAVVFEWSGVREMGQQFADAAALSIPDTVTRSAYLAHREEIEVVMVVTQLFGVRVALILAGVPVGLENLIVLNRGYCSVLGAPILALFVPSGVA
jgi:hypothetical protein